MKLGAYSIPIRGFRLGIRLCVIPLIVLTSLVMSNLITAQTDAPGETVIIPGREIIPLSLTRAATASTATSGLQRWTCPRTLHGLEPNKPALFGLTETASKK